MSPPLLLMAVRVAVLAVAGKAFPLVLDIDRPPAPLVALLKQLKDPDPTVRDAAAERLGATDRFAPYLRDKFFAWMKVPQPYRSAVFRELDRRRHERLAGRALAWADQRRADMIAEYLVLPSTDEQVAGQVAPVFRLLPPVAADYNRLTRGVNTPGTKLALQIVEFEKFVNRPKRLADSTVRLNGRTFPSIVQADRCELIGVGGFSNLVAVRDELRVVLQPAGSWCNSVVLVNGPSPNAWPSNLHYSILVFDGDVVLQDWAELDDTIIISNGTIRAAERPGVSSFGSFLWAADGIEFPTGFKNPKAVLASGGRIRLGPNEMPADRVRENLKADPLGFRFFTLDDVGLAVAEQPAGLTVTAVSPWSRFAAYDVRAGDVIARVNDRPAGGVREFRRQVRQAVVAESGVFNLRRGGESVNRIVVFR